MTSEKNKVVRVAIKISLFSSLLYINLATAACWFSCDETNRNLSTDAAKVYREIESIGGKQTKSENNKKFFCRRNNENEMQVFSVEKDTEREFLIVNMTQYSPPQYGSSSWEPTNGDFSTHLRIPYALNFGLLGNINNESSDKRCRSSLVGFQRGVSGIENFVTACSYAKDAELPISDWELKRYSDFVLIRNCQ